MKKFMELTEKEFNTLLKKQHVRISSDVIRTKLGTLVKGANTFLLYIWLTTNIAREGWDDSKGFPLKKEFYEKGYLACTFPIPKIMELFEISRSTVFRNLQKMLDLGWIEIGKIKGNNQFRSQNVYILGEWTFVIVDGRKEYIETLYFNN